MGDGYNKIGGGRDKLIVMPVQSAGAETGPGLGLHFLLGNLVCLHPGLLECWFGWRVTHIFDTPEDLRHYCRGHEPFSDIQGLGAKEKVRFWLEGCCRGTGQGIEADLALHDTGSGSNDQCRLVLNEGDGADAFCREFVGWMASAGLDYGRPGPALWPERISLEGLACLGDALEILYASYLAPGDGPMDLGLFKKAADLCPESYLAQDLLGWGLYKNGDGAGAAAAFTRAVDINRDGLGALAGLMWCAVEAKDKPAALHYALEKARCRGGDPEKARALVEKKFSPDIS